MTRRDQLLFVLALLLAGCGGSGSSEQPCDENTATTPGPISLSAAMSTVAMLSYSTAGAGVTLGGSFTVVGGTDVRVRLYDSYASTHYDLPVEVVDGVVTVPTFMWSPSSAPRTLVLYASSASPATATQATLFARECTP